MSHPLSADRLRHLQVQRRSIERRRPSLSGPALATIVVAVQFIAMFVAAAVQPAAADETVAWAWLGDLIAIGYVGALMLALLSIPSARLSVGASTAAAAIGGVLILACPLTGHHELGGWWFGQLGAFAVAAVISVGGLWRLRADRS